MDVPVLNILQKYLRVDVFSGSYICQLPNPYEKDWSDIIFTSSTGCLRGGKTVDVSAEHFGQKKTHAFS